MFDPEVILDERLASEFGLKPGDIPFYAKAKGDENELKFLTQMFEKIRHALHNAHNRRIDMRSYNSNPYVLVTLNLDTKDRQLAKAGYSMRVRFAFDPNDKINPIKQIDMSIKTELQKGQNGILFGQTRGEWEAALKTLKPSLAAMIEQNIDTAPPLPDFFKDGHLTDDMFFVESIGCTMRNNYPSYEKFVRRGKILVSEFHHTEDIANVFLTPHGDQITSHDSEAESEFIGIHNLTNEDATPEEFEKLKHKSMRLQGKLIIGADTVNIRPNELSKSIRARQGLVTAYDDFLVGAFDKASRIHQASEFALSMGVKPEDVNLNILMRVVAKLFAQVERLRAPIIDDTFQPAKYMQ